MYAKGDRIYRQVLVGKENNYPIQPGVFLQYQRNELKGVEAVTMIFSFDAIIAYVSQFMTLRTGDLIFTGTPAGVGSVKINDLLDVYLEGERMMHFRIK